ncbi:MAG: hydrogenase 3 maturation endopeptidase HyCI [Candidatus Bathyarchaeota archaeon]|nr:hydrogenase 3 maturation endopeptidase HyCI [Candidatus Bathyarchaeota archaeon]
MGETQFGFEEELKNWLSGAKTVVVAGIGNDIRMDDFVGVKIVQDLQGKVSSKVHLIECETVPESFMDEIVELKPSHVLLVDAALLGLNPGEIRLYDSAKVVNMPTISTHMLPLRMFCDYITQMAQAKLTLLLVEPKETDFGEGLSDVVAESAGRIVDFLLKTLP